MSVFGSYSRYYNLMYRDKDYTGEVAYIESLIRKYQPRAKTVLDLGCGTGRHDSLLCNKGYIVHGVDCSKEMLKIANKTASGKNLSYSLGDIRTIRLGKKFDTVVSLFHVMSYQISNDDLQKALTTAYGHLKAEGIFIFDCWYGPAVLNERPAERVKRLEDKDIEVIRLAKPVMCPNENIVDVNYHMTIRDKANGKVEELKETHRMRYLFKPEVAGLCERVGFKLLDVKEWMTNKEPGLDTWSVYFVVGI